MRRMVIATSLVGALTVMVGEAQKSAEVTFQAATAKQQVDGDLKGAIALFMQAIEEAGNNRVLAARALLQIAECYRKLGDSQAQAVYERIVRDYSDQTEVAASARARLPRAGDTPAVRGDRPVWSGPKVDPSGRVSRDGRYVSYTDWTGFNNLAIHDLTTRTDRILTLNTSHRGGGGRYDGEVDASVISPDGTQIAYSWLGEVGPDRAEVRIVALAGGTAHPPRTLARFGSEAQFTYVVDWSPDAQLLAVDVVRPDATRQLMVIGVADGKKRVLRSMEWRGAQNVFFSADSRYLAFDLPASEDEHQRDIFLIAVDGSQQLTAVAGPSDDRVAGWSPDGTHLLFTSDRTPSTSLWVLPVADGKPQGRAEQLRADVGRGMPLGVSKSGTLYLYKDVGNLDVKVAQIDLNAGRLIAEPTHFSRGVLPSPTGAQWSPDGQHLVYEVFGIDRALVIRSAATGEVRLLPRKTVSTLAQPRWSPDGRWLLGSGRDSKGRRGIFKVDVQTGEATAVAYSPENAGLGLARWAPDGRSIYYYRDTRARVIESRDLETGAERQIFTHPQLTRTLEVSPDGKHLAVWTRGAKTASVLLIDTVSGSSHELISVPTPEMIGHQNSINNSIAWTRDSRALLVAKNVSGKVGFLLIDVVSGQVRRLDVDTSGWAMTTAAATGGFALSPDNRSIAFLMGQSRRELWAIENVVPRQAATRSR